MVAQFKFFLIVLPMPTAIMLISIKQFGSFQKTENDAWSLLMCIILHVLYIIAGSSFFRDCSESIRKQFAFVKKQFFDMGLLISIICHLSCIPFAKLWHCICTCLHFLIQPLLEPILRPLILQQQQPELGMR